jgi:DNA polymerase III subunit gamma/tau
MKDLAIELRPMRLDDVYYQKRIISELKERASKNNWPLAMLFKGPSGTGKSTTAQIVAMTINCKNLKNGDPCCECPSCKSIMEERFDRDTLVLDGSTLGLKDNIIEFGNIAEIAPSYDKKRILIIEESDQLSDSAKNALHKILEKPRNHVHFILLSMYSTGLPTSIQTRCQTYNFKAFETYDIAMGLKATMERLNLWNDTSIPDSFKLEGLMTLSSVANGSFREALQYLEKCLVTKSYTKNEIRENLGIVDTTTVIEIINKILNLDVKVFKDFEDIGFKTFFDEAYSTLTSALTLGVSGFITNEYFKDMYKALSIHPKASQLLSIFDEIFINSKPYIRKEYFYSKLLSFFQKNNVVTNVKPMNDTTEFNRKQAVLDAEFAAQKVSGKNDPEIPVRATRIPRG